MRPSPWGPVFLPLPAGVAARHPAREGKHGVPLSGWAGPWGRRPHRPGLASPGCWPGGRGACWPGVLLGREGKGRSGGVAVSGGGKREIEREMGWR